MEWILVIISLIGRFLALLLWYGFSLAIFYKSTSLDSKHHAFVRKARLVRDIFALSILSSFIFEGYFIATSVPINSIPDVFSVVFAGIRPFGMIHLTAGIVLVFVSLAYLASLIWPQMRIIYAGTTQEYIDANGQPEEKVFEAVDFLQSMNLPPLTFWCDRRMSRFNSIASIHDGRNALAVALICLSRNSKADALKWVLKWRPSSTEALILAHECSDWKESLRLISQIHDPLLRAETAQLICLKDAGRVFDRLGLQLLEDDQYSRRRAAIVFRQGNADSARQLLHQDEEARNWIYG